MDPWFTKAWFLQKFNFFKAGSIGHPNEKNAISDISDREKLCVIFREMFLQTKNGNFESGKKLVIFKMFEKRLSNFFWLTKSVSW